MATAAIVGAGQGGLHLAFGLLHQGHAVTIITDRSADDIERQSAMASHTLQTPALIRERSVGACASDLVPQNWGIGVDFALSLDSKSATGAWQGDWDEPSAAMDLRLKYPLLLRQFEHQGGLVTVASATQETLEQLTLDFDMVFIATGKASLGGLFAVDESRTVFDAPQRHLTQLLIRGVPSVEGQERLYFRFLPEHGEIFMGPILHMSKQRAHTFLIEARPGGDFDRFGDIANPQEALSVARGIVDEHLAWEPMLRNVTLADPLAYLKGAIRPLVRRPVAHLEATGRSVYAVGDVAFVHDPIAGQGGNCTVAYVDHLLSTIDKTPSDRLDPDFVEERYEDFWHTQGQFIVGLSVAMVAPPTPALQKILGAAAQSRSVADRVASAFAYPERIAPFLGSEAKADEFIASAQGKPASLNEQEPAPAR